MVEITTRPYRSMTDSVGCRKVAISCWTHAIADRVFEQMFEGFYLVTEIDGDIAGFTGARRSYLAPGAWEIPWIAVDPARHGQRIGSQLLHHLIRELTNIRRASVILTMTQRTGFFGEAGFEVLQSYEDGWCLMTLQAGPVGI